MHAGPPRLEDSPLNAACLGPSRRLKQIVIPYHQLLFGTSVDNHPAHPLDANHTPTPLKVPTPPVRPTMPPIPHNNPVPVTSAYATSRLLLTTTTSAAHHVLPSVPRKRALARQGKVATAISLQLV